MDTLTVGRGDDKRAVPVNEVSDKDLAWYANECRNAKLKGIAQAEQKRRGGGGSQQRPTQSRAIQRQSTSGMAVEGSFGDATQATSALRSASERYHLISPATVCGALPEGCDVTLSLVHINPDDPGLYKLPGGKLGLSKVHLDQIAAAAGATTVVSERLDDGSHPHYCAWRVVIAWRLFDGQLVHRQGNVEIDVREPDGAAYVEICAKNASPEKQLLELRKFLTRHAESKAANRAIAAMGLRRSYTAAELAKPFAVARLQFTGRSEDPQARQEFRAAIAQSFLGGNQQLYGGAPAQHRESAQLPPYEHPPAQFAPPPQGADYTAEGEAAPPSEPSQTGGPIGDGYDDRGDNPDAY